MTLNEAIEKLKSTSPLRITVSGDIGAGKSTFAKRLAEALGVPRIYMGGLMRDEASRRGMTLAEFGKMQESDDSVDRAMDEMLHGESERTDRGVFEGRTAWHFAVDPKIRVFLSADPQIAAERILGDENNTKRDKLGALDEVIADNALRKESEITRYKNYYNINAYDLANFDVVVDTSNINADEVFERTIIKIAELAGS